jgi:hypothetical protein
LNAQNEKKPGKKKQEMEKPEFFLGLGESGQPYPWDYGQDSVSGNATEQALWC